MEYRQIKAIDYKNKQLIKSICPSARDESGIYILTREENGFKFAYIGQSLKVLTRLAQHLRGYQRIDLSLRKHKFWSESNSTGYKIECLDYPPNLLDQWEQYYIRLYASKGYQLRNETSGSQGVGKKDIAEKVTKGYLEGVHNGYRKAQKEIAHLFDLHLDFVIKGKPNKIKDKAFVKFKEFLEGGKDEK